MTDTISGVVIILIGLLAIIGAALNWRLVTRPRRLLNMVLGDTVARTIYMIVGVLLVILGVGRLVGTNWLGR
jgi:hypothetical protein